MSNYLEVYRARLAHNGANPQIHAFKSGILEFKKDLQYNEHTERGLDKDGYLFDGVILTDKQDENRISQILLVELETKINVGDLIKWHGTYWLIYKQIKSSYQPYQKFYMVECNYKIKWVDKEGILHESWSHIVGSLDSKIKDNFRTWHALITPQPNKYIEIMMPYQYIAKETEIIVNDESWYLVDYDKTSVPEIIYMSFTENKVNTLRDNQPDSIANYDQLRKCTFSAVETIQANVGDILVRPITLYIDGIRRDDIALDYSLTGDLDKDDNNNIIVGGDGTITAKIDDETITVTVSTAGEPQLEHTLVGDEKVRVSRSATYELLPSDITEDLNFVLSNNLASITSIDKGTCVIQTNNNNKLGEIILSVDYDGTHYEKTIQIVALWQVM